MRQFLRSHKVVGVIANKAKPAQNPGSKPLIFYRAEDVRRVLPAFKGDNAKELVSTAEISKEVGMTKTGVRYRLRRKIDAFDKNGRIV